MNNPPLFDRIKSANAEMLQEILREAEIYLNAQLTAAIAADLRAYTFAGVISAASVILVSAAYGLVVTVPANTFLAYTAVTVSALLFAAAWMAVMSAQSVSFEFAGNQPCKWVADIESGVQLTHAIAEQCARYDGMLATNSVTMERNSQLFNWAVNLALTSIGIGGLAFVYWMSNQLVRGRGQDANASPTTDCLWGQSRPARCLLTS